MSSLMRWFGVVAIGAATMACSVYAEIPLTVMTSNVRFGTAKDGDNHWDKRKDILVEAIRSQSPDLIGTQETLDFQAQYIAEKLPEYAWFGIGREKDGKGEMTAIFYKKNILTPVEKGEYWLSETPEVPGSMSWKTACTRMVTWGRFKHAPTGQSFYYANTHFDHISEEARINSAKLMTARLPKEGETVIVTGDFNSLAETSTCWQTFKECGFTDSWLVAEEKVGPDQTFGNFNTPTGETNSRIDWVLFKGNVKVQKIETCLFNQSGHYPSDHYPVVARMLLK